MFDRSGNDKPDIIGISESQLNDRKTNQERNYMSIEHDENTDQRNRD